MPGMPNWRRKAFDRWRDQAEVFGDQGQPAEMSTGGLEEVGARARNPTAVDRRRFTCGHFPVRFEPAEMIEPHYVHLFEARDKPVQPPAIAALLQRFPIVERIAPELAGGAEIVRRHSGDDGRLAMLVEIKQIGVGPDVGRIARDENRQVSDQLDTVLVRVALQIAPLPEEKELGKPVPRGRLRPNHGGHRSSPPVRGGESAQAIAANSLRREPLSKP